MSACCCMCNPHSQLACLSCVCATQLERNTKILIGFACDICVFVCVFISFISFLCSKTIVNMNIKTGEITLKNPDADDREQVRACVRAVCVREDFCIIACFVHHLLNCVPVDVCMCEVIHGIDTHVWVCKREVVKEVVNMSNGRIVFFVFKVGYALTHTRTHTHSQSRSRSIRCMTTRRSRSFSLKRLLSLLSTASSRCVAVCVLRCVCCGAYVALRLLQCLCCSSPFSTVSSWCVQCLLQYCSMCVALCSDNYGTVCRVTHVKEACHAFELGVSHI